MPISKISRGAYDPIVKLSDDSTSRLSVFLQTPGALTISGVVRQAYNGIVQDSDGNVFTLAEHSRTTVNAAGTQTVAKYVGTGYDTVVQDGSGNYRPLTEYQANEDGVAVAEEPSEESGENAVEIVTPDDATKIEE